MPNHYSSLKDVYKRTYEELKNPKSPIGIFLASVDKNSALEHVMSGTRVRAVSRLDPEAFWMGTVTMIDTENASQDNVDMWSSNMVMDMMTTSSSYVFYVQLDDPTGLLLGQHLYVEVYQEEREGLWLPESFIAEFAFDEQTGTETIYVWVAGPEKTLQKRAVTLGMYDGMIGCYEIVDGLSAEDYVADPMDPGCQEGAAVSYRNADDFAGEAEG